MLKHKYIVVEGNIGAGKTTLAQMLALKFNARLVLENFADNTFLPQFYKDPVRFAFSLEMSFMADRYSQLKGLFDRAEQKGNPVVSDYFFSKCLLFAKVNLNEDEYTLFHNFFKLLQDHLPQPDLVVYLKKDINSLQRNIQKRGRAFEKDIPNHYLTDITRVYNAHINEIPGNKKIIVDAGRLDFVANPLDYSAIVEMILNS